MIPKEALPAFKGMKGLRRSLKDIRGQEKFYVVDDEIQRLQSTFHEKMIVLQKIRWEYGGHVEYRLGYYMIGQKPGARGRWTWGQYATFIPADDMKAIYAEAHERGWL